MFNFESLEPSTSCPINDLSFPCVDNLSHFLYPSLVLRIARKYRASSFSPTKFSIAPILREIKTSAEIVEKFEKSKVSHNPNL
jgi:peptidoglycan biosynthesis protein MviN/MurJ (putative lipid II flippase)